MEGMDDCIDFCINEDGSYSCSCDSGYRLTSDGHGCEDIDECEEDRSGCSQTCTNTNGSYTCSCDAGFKLATDGHMCEGMIHK